MRATMIGRKTRRRGALHSLGSWPARALPLGALLATGCTGVIGNQGDGQLGGPPSGGAGTPAAGGSPGTAIDVPSPEIPLPGATLAANSALRRLTSYEYDNTIRDLLGDDSRRSRELLPEDNRKLFDNDYTTQATSTALIEGAELLASDVVKRLMTDQARRHALVGCTPAGATDQACFQAFLTRFGRLALRRPLSADEVARWGAAFMPLAQDAKDFYAAVESALLAFLQHPELLYRVETGAAVVGAPGIYKLTDWQLAARLSYFIWGSTPDELLLDQAAAGALRSPEGVRGAATRLLNDKRARELWSRFHAQWFGYDGAPLTPDLAAGMVQETAALIGRVVFDDARPWQDLFRATETFIDGRLAAHYGMPSSDSTPRWVRYDASSQRKGILSHASFLAVGAKFEDTSPTMRGIAVRERLLCTTVPPPPPGVDVDAPPLDDAGACKEERYQMHRHGGCAGCHALIDEIGFGLERFDQQGRYRTREEKLPACAIRGQGELVGVGSFSGPGELGDRLIQSGELNNCAATQLHRFTVGRTELDETDRRAVELLARRMGGGDFRLGDLILDVVSADAFRHVRRD